MTDITDGNSMNKQDKKGSDNHYLQLMLALFGAAALSILLFFIVFRFDGIRDAFGILLNVLRPFLIGAVLAYILKPSCNFIEEKLTNLFQKQADRWSSRTPARHGTKRTKHRPQDTSAVSAPKISLMKLVPGLSIFITLVLALAVIIILLLMVLPTLLESIYSIILLIPGSIEYAAEWLLQYAGDNETLSNYITDLSESFSTWLPNWIRSTVLPNLEVLIGNLSNSVSGIISVVSNVFIGIIAAIYIMGCRKTFARQAKKINYSIFGKKWSNRILEEVRYADRVFSGFINGRLIDSLIIGVICFIGMLILQMPYAMLVSVIVGITNIIPFFGPYIGAIPSFLLILMVNPVKAVIFLVFIMILQQFDGNILGPRILGNVTGLSGFWVLFAILTFGGLFGFIGMIVGVPLFAVIYDIIRKLMNYGVARQKTKEQQPVDIQK